MEAGLDIFALIAAKRKNVILSNKTIASMKKTPTSSDSTIQPKKAKKAATMDNNKKDDDSFHPSESSDDDQDQKSLSASTIGSMSRKLPLNLITRTIAPPQVMRVDPNTPRPVYYHTDRCSVLFDHNKAMKHRQKIPPILFPKLDPNAKAKTSYTHWGVTYITMSGLPQIRTVSIKNESDKFVKHLTKYDILPKQKHSKGTPDVNPGALTAHQTACTKFVGTAPYVLTDSKGEVASVTHTFPLTLMQCPRLLSYQGPPATNDELVRMVTSCYVCFLDKPIDNNMTCSNHSSGCGKSVVRGDLIVCDASECELVEGKVYYIAARRVKVSEKREVEKECKVGIVKCLFNQLNLFAHRVGVVVDIQKKEEVETTTQYMKNKCHSVAEVKFLDGGNFK